MSIDPRFSITNSTTQALTRIERARGFLEVDAAARPQDAHRKGVANRTGQRPHRSDSRVSSR